MFVNKYVEYVYKVIFYGGVGFIMVKVREEFWIFCLRCFVKKVIRECYGCKCFQVVVFVVLFFGLLYLERIEGLIFFEIVGVDFVGLIKYCKFFCVEGKGYLVFYMCSLMRVLYLEVLFNLEIIIFFLSLKCFIVRCG